ncbi:hypothetical protein J4421_02955 [Candidatus Woesearchaeota archaeon]|nr:hypothetical protein [Candidatus Woesearchaeota archaeon]
MLSLTTEQLFKKILPTIERYVGYALRIQKGIHSQDKGDSTDNEAIRAFTDADVIVQEGIARDLKKILDEGYSFRFVPEEESPYNHLFPKESPITVTLDPIDGTLLFKRGYPGFCTILAKYVNGYLDGVLVHNATNGATYCATQDEEGNNKIISMNVPEEQAEALRERGIELLQFGTPEIPPDLEMNAMCHGKIGGYFKLQASAFDWGPFSLIVKNGGGFVSDFQGNEHSIQRYWGRNDGTKEGNTPSIIAVADKRLHETLVDVLSR